LERNYYSGELEPINWRFDPDVRMPSPYCKFLRFNGPYFSPTKPHPRELNTFYLPESLVNIIHYYTRKCEQAENNLRATGSVPTQTDEEEAEHQFQQKVVHPIKETKSRLTLSIVTRHAIGRFNG
jgi:hypothetical protein